ncbi:MAG: patatin-like phospholipase family protein [Candidatus Omnitrophica bacterium]|nr:patatin-like phospholipase family protein [Candidatus Omnitrophota bacterium]
MPNEAAREAVRAYALGHAVPGKTPTIVYLGRDVDLSGDREAFVLDTPGGHRRYAWKLVYENHKLPDFSIEKSFSHMKAQAEDKDTKVIMAFSGGGLKVFATATIVRFLNALGIYKELDEIWGTSGGAIAGLWYSCHIPPEKVQDYGFALYNRLFSLKLSPSKFDVIKNLFVNYCLPEKFRPSGFHGFINCTKSLTDFINAIKEDASLQKPFYCVAFNIQQLKTEVLTSEPVDPNLYNQKIHTVEPIEGAVASSSVPILFAPKTIRRNGCDIQYVDGGLEENIPLKSIYEKWVIDRKSGREKRRRLLIISSGLENENRLDLFNPKSANDRDMINISLSLLFQAIENSQRALLAQDPAVSLWDFQVPLSKYPVFDVKFIPQFYKIGYQEVASKTLEIESRLAQAKRLAA